jgi:hypothetical protein
MIHPQEAKGPAAVEEAIFFRFSLFLHWTLFAWLAWCAFPYMGELP